MPEHETDLVAHAQLTAVEEHLVQFSLDSRAALVAELDQAQEAEKVALNFFQSTCGINLRAPLDLSDQRLSQ